MSDASFSIVANCHERPVAGFDLNKDGMIGLVDAVLFVNAVGAEAEETPEYQSREYVEMMLTAVFSSSP